jgi:hypothetical protein
MGNQIGEPTFAGIRIMGRWFQPAIQLQADAMQCDVRFFDSTALGDKAASV